MTLRVRISIVPFGDETKEREIHQINISNLGESNDKLFEYGVELNKYKTHDYNVKVNHWREDGSVALVAAALDELLEKLEGQLK